MLEEHKPQFKYAIRGERPLPPRDLASQGPLASRQLAKVNTRAKYLYTPEDPTRRKPRGNTGLNASSVIQLRHSSMRSNQRTRDPLRTRVSKPARQAGAASLFLYVNGHGPAEAVQVTDSGDARARRSYAVARNRRGRSSSQEVQSECRGDVGEEEGSLSRLAWAMAPGPASACQQRLSAAVQSVFHP